MAGKAPDDMDPNVPEEDQRKAMDRGFYWRKGGELVPDLRSAEGQDNAIARGLVDPMEQLYLATGSNLPNPVPAEGNAAGDAVSAGNAQNVATGDLAKLIALGAMANKEVPQLQRYFGGLR